MKKLILIAALLLASNGHAHDEQNHSSVTPLSNQ